MRYYQALFALPSMTPVTVCMAIQSVTVCMAIQPVTVCMAI